MNPKKNIKSNENIADKDSDSSSNDSKHSGMLNKEILVDFDGRNPIDTDADGIRQLLQQLFLKAHINYLELSNLIIGQNYIGSVITQGLVSEESDDEDDLDSNENMVFGITTAINISTKENYKCINELKCYITDKVEQYANGNTVEEIKNILADKTSEIGFIINERFINIPAQISVPLLENLYKEIKRAKDKKMPYNFSYYIMLIKFYRKEGTKKQNTEDIYTNAEEEVICEEALYSFDYSVQTESDSGLSGDWSEDDTSLVPYRKFVLFEANKLSNIITLVKNFLAE